MKITQNAPGSRFTADTTERNYAENRVDIQRKDRQFTEIGFTDVRSGQGMEGAENQGGSCRKSPVHCLEEKFIEQFAQFLKLCEKSEATIKKYVRDAEAFRTWCIADGDSSDDASSGTTQATVTRARVLRYKEGLLTDYKLNSANARLSALNAFFKYAGWDECRVSTFKVQAQAYRSTDRDLTREEYKRLLRAARDKGRMQICHVMETIAATGIRVSELPFITVQALRTRTARVTLKGKTRTVLLPRQLCDSLRAWCTERRITEGSIFVTRTGRPLDRSNILHMMKALAEAAGILRSKLFPHNLRHLFAVTCYEEKKDLVQLAGLLGHANVNTTRIYTLISSERQLAVLDGIGALLLPGAGTGA